MRQEDPEKFFEYFRMSTERFDELLELVKVYLQKYSLNDNISPAERLAATLRYLASGCDMRTISFAFLISPSTMSLIIRETCQVLWKVLSPIVFPNPSEAEWRRIAQQFEQWHFPHCLGSIDGKHCIVQAFPNTGSDWFNYKRTFSMVLLGLVDANYKFIMVDIGGRGRRIDGGLLRTSNFGQMLYNRQLNFPNAEVLPSLQKEVPFVIVADEAFPLTENLMKPFSGDYLSDEKRIFNYRLSRARRVVENAFGVLGARWRILRKTIASKGTARAIIKACVVLHNMQVLNESRTRSAERRYMPVNYIDVEDREGRIILGQYRNELPENGVMDLRDDEMRIGARNYGVEAQEVRELFTDYFLGEGQVWWQWNLLPYI